MRLAVTCVFDNSNSFPSCEHRRIVVLELEVVVAVVVVAVLIVVVVAVLLVVVVAVVAVLVVVVVHISTKFCQEDKTWEKGTLHTGRVDPLTIIVIRYTELSTPHSK